MTSKSSVSRPVVGRTAAESTPWWPDPVLPPAGAPNIVIVLLDDTGFAHLRCFGGPIPTPNFDRLAERGLRFTNFHTTALCSPSRACLLTGRNHHAVGMRALSNFDTGFDNMRGRIDASAATVAEMLQEVGYGTFAVGKWHLAPMRDASAAGPFHQWPLGRGFDRYYGFMQGETDQFHPELYRDNHLVNPPETPENGYHVSADLVDEAIEMIRNHCSLVPERPFFTYLAFGATHAPHQAPPEYLERYRGAFDEGWDVWRHRTYEHQLELGVIPAGTDLAPRNPGVEPWDDLSADEKTLALRLQEAFAAMLDHTDAQVGRLLDALDDLGLTDDTVVMVMSDNGASQEGQQYGVTDTFRYFNGVPENVADAVNRLDDIGGPRSNTNYPWGWAQVGNTPAKRYKQNTHGGGVRDPLIVSWPGGIDPTVNGQVRRQFHHITDVTPTLLELVGIQAPTTYKGVEQQPIHGTSFAYAFGPEADDVVEVPTAKSVQYFEMFGHRGIYSDGWKAVTFHERGRHIDDDNWELYHLDEDFSECHDLAGAEPERLARMVELFWIEAGRYGVLPIQERDSRLFGGHKGAGNPAGRDRFLYHPPIARIPADAAPALGSRTWHLRALLDRSDARASGAILSMGTSNNGLALYLDGDGHLVYDHNAFGHHTVLRSSDSVPAGQVTVELRQERVRGGPAMARIAINERQVSEAVIPLVPAMISSIGLDIGRSLTGACRELRAPAEFDGRIIRVEIDTERAMNPDDEAALAWATALGTQ
ncbi:MAG: arylsulfatase [Actinomycetota bacterium]|nr:arylsulfatase [Actinomycetota bacterium]